MNGHSEDIESEINSKIDSLPGDSSPWTILNVVIKGLNNRIKEQDETIELLEITNKNLLEDIMELTGKA